MTSLKVSSLPEYFAAYQKSVDTPEQFWADIAETFQWKKKWAEVYSADFSKPDIKWFSGAQLNITENIFERRLKEEGSRVALIWEPNDPAADSISLTYQELYVQVCQFSNVLEARGVKRGDRVVLYMPMVPEAAIAMLACARIGAIHSVVFAGFSARSLADRINDCGATMVITADENLRGAKCIPVKQVVDEALEKCDSVKEVIVYQRTGAEVAMQSGRDNYWHELLEGVSETHEAVALEAEDPLFILYTSGSTGKPKGVVHSQAGYMVYTAYTFENVFQTSPGDVYWCTADVGWITGHSYIVYGPLLQGSTVVMFEGVPTYPGPGRFWEVVEKHKVTHFYTAPTAIRALQPHGSEPIEKCDLSSLKVLGTVGEPINEDAWRWYHHHVGGGRCPIVDTWWQTETGGMMLSPIAGITPTKPSFATLPLPGIQPVLLTDDGQEIQGNAVEGNLCIKAPWPSMLRTTYGDHERCRATYFERFPGYYFTGDGARRDEEGYYRIMGRVDDVINVSGHRIGTAEVEDAINEHPAVTESAVVGIPHKVKGQSIAGFVIAECGPKEAESIAKEIRQTVRNVIGPLASPEKIVVVPGLPRTRSGKIMRRILREVACGQTEEFGDTSTLLNPEIVDSIVKASSATE